MKYITRLSLLLILSPVLAQENTSQELFTPTESPINLEGINAVFYGDVAYENEANHPLEVLDIFIPKGIDTPTGIVIEIHGGGYIAGDKSTVYSSAGETRIRSFLEDGISYANINYKLLEIEGETVGINLCKNSGKLAIQFLKYYSGYFNLDKDLFTLKGNSAGSGIAMWLAYQDSMADPLNSNPILQESTTIKAIALYRPQATSDFVKWETVVFLSIPEYNIRDDYQNNLDHKQGVDRTYVMTLFDQIHTLSIVYYRETVDYLGFISQGGGIETFISSPDPLITQVINYTIPNMGHSPLHGKALKDTLDGENINNTSYLNGIFTDPSGESEIEFLKRKINETPFSDSLFKFYSR